MYTRFAPRFAPRFSARLLLFALSTFAGAALGGEFFEKEGAALRGYDPVAYFTDTDARQGKAEFSARWEGAEWRFVSGAHRALFLAEPERYAPRYGGWCAYGVTKGVAAEADPAGGWAIYDGRLYLTYDAGTRARWSQDIAANLVAADARWPAIEAGLLDGTARIYRK